MMMKKSSYGVKNAKIKESDDNLNPVDSAYAAAGDEDRRSNEK